MNKPISKAIILLLSSFLFLGCTPNKPSSDTPSDPADPGTDPVDPGTDPVDPKTEEGYFQNIKDELEKGVTEEKTWATFYDKDDNRFVLTLHYDLNFGLAIHIEEYDLWNFLVNANGGTVSEDAESITFTNSALEKTDLFKKGTYVLAHNNGNFTLNAAGVVLNLTTTVKEDPHYIYKDLVGSFEYKVSEDTKFTLDVEVGTKADHYPVTISIKEGDKSFTGSNIKNNSTTTTFDISGTSDGEYIKASTGVTFTYSEINGTYKLKIGNNTYSLSKLEEEEEEYDKGYFERSAGKYKFTCNDFEVRVSNMTGNAYIQLVFKELVEGGNPNFQCLFQIIDNDTITNVQSITNSKNKVFVGHNKYTFKHSKTGNTDKVDLYFDEVLAYENLTIVSIEA